MNKRQENKVSMYIFVETICKENRKEWQGIKAITETKKEFSGIIKSIERERLLQEEQFKGVTKTRKETSQKLVTITMEFILALGVYALETDDKILAEKVNYTKTDLNTSRDTILRDKCRLIYEIAEVYNEKLSDYGILPDMLDDFKSILNSFVTTLSDSKIALNNRKIATKKINELITQGDNLLNNKLDKLVKLLKNKSPKFHESYFNARKMINAGIRYKVKNITSAQAA